MNAGWPVEFGGDAQRVVGIRLGTCGGQAFAARLANVVRSGARAGTTNLVYRHGRSSDWSGILFEKKIQRKARAPMESGDFPI